MSLSGIPDPHSDPGAHADAGCEPLPVLRSSSRGLGPGECVDSWREQLIHYSENDSLEAEPGDFFFDAASWHFGSLVLTDCTIGALRHLRSSRKVRTSPTDHYKLVLPLEGDTRLDADGERLLLRPGQLAVTDMSRPQSYDAERGRKITMFVAREALDEALPAPMYLHGRVVEGAIAGLLRTHLTHLAAHAGTLPASSAADMAAATLQLMACALAHGATPAREAVNAIESTLLRQVCRYIELHLADADLGAETLCGIFKISRASLYRLFEPLGGVSRHVLERRLVRIHEQLAGSAGRVHLASLADTFGFRSASHFSQAFRRQFGYSPSDVRSQLPPMIVPLPEGGPARLSEWLRGLRA